jgi:hypothetical protein
MLVNLSVKGKSSANEVTTPARRPRERAVNDEYEAGPPRIFRPFTRSQQIWPTDRKSGTPMIASGPFSTVRLIFSIPRMHVVKLYATPLYNT